MDRGLGSIGHSLLPDLQFVGLANPAHVAPGILNLSGNSDKGFWGRCCAGQSRANQDRHSPGL